MGLSAYVIGSGAAYFSPWIAPLVGIVVASLTYSVLLYVSSTKSITTQEA